MSKTTFAALMIFSFTNLSEAKGPYCKGKDEILPRARARYGVHLLQKRLRAARKRRFGRR
jgi:hypothetical protein